MNQITTLSKIFVRYKTYPIGKYISQSPVSCFQRLYPDNYFSSQIEDFLSNHTYKPSRRGADLPWWGSKYFTKEHGRRIMIVSQDSLAEDAGSIVFWACLYPANNPKHEYRKFTQEFGLEFKGWEIMRKQLLDWKIDLQFCYITDASKVYKDTSWKNKDFDQQKSRELLEVEIELCNPDLVILLGGSPLFLVDPAQNYAQAVEAGKPLQFRNRKYVVAPFPIGQGRTQKNFKERLKTASGLIASIPLRL